MNDLQAIIDFQIELHKFVNIDLFQRGLYQVRLSHHLNTKIAHKIEVSFLEDCSIDSTKQDDSQSSIASFTSAPGVINGVAVSKTFYILYKNEEKMLNDVINFKDHLLIDSSNCLSQLSDIEFYLNVELWFTESNFVSNNQELMRLICRRQLRLHFDVCRGLHYFLPVMFDYFHLSAVTLSVHACLVTLCLPYLSKQGLNGKMKQTELNTSNTEIGYDHLFFACSFDEIRSQIKANCADILNLRQRRAQLLHWQMCTLLFSALQNLSRKLNEYIKLLPPLVQCKFKKDFPLTQFQLKNLSELARNCHQSCLENSGCFESCNQDFMEFAARKSADNKKFTTTDQTENSSSSVDHVDTMILPNGIKKMPVDDKLTDKNDNVLTNDHLPSIYQPEDYIVLIVSDLAYICGSLITINQIFTKLVTNNEKINQHLSKIHHLHRCKRFAEFFFVKEKSPLHLTTPAITNGQTCYELSERVRKSNYFHLLPVCQVECVSLDGDHHTMPVIFEERFDLNEIILKSSQLIEKKNSIDKNSNDKDHKISLEQNTDETKKNLRRSSSDVSSNSSFTDSSTDNSNSKPASDHSSSVNNSADDVKQVKRSTSSKLRERFVHSLNKFNLSGGGGLTRRKSSISYLSKQDQQKMALSAHLSSSSTTDSNNSSLNSQLTTKSLNVESHKCTNDETNQKSTLKEEKLDTSIELISFRHYKGIRDELEELLLDSNAYSVVEISDAKRILDQPHATLVDSRIVKKKSRKHRKKNMTNSESMPDLSVKNLQKSIKRMTKKSSKKLKSKKDQKILKRLKSADLSSKTVKTDHLDTISLNFHSNILESLNRNNLILNEKNAFSDLDAFIDEDDCSSITHLENDHSDKNSADDDVTLDAEEKKIIPKNELTPKCTILEMITRNACLVCGTDNCNCVQDLELTMGSKHHRLSMITKELVAFVRAKERFRQDAALKKDGWQIYSDYSNQASKIPYFQCDSELIKTFNVDGVHLVVCVHGLDGNCADLRLVKTYLELGLPFSKFDFLMSESNQGKTYDSFEVMTDRLCDEILNHIQKNCLEPSKVSFIGYSLGNIIIRSVLRKPELDFLLPKLHCFLSLSGPHLGTIYMTNNLVNIGLFLMQKWKKSTSLLQLCLKDNADPYKTFIYNLSKDSKMHLFKYVMLCGSSQDHYVPKHSAHIEFCNQSVNDQSVTGKCYREMINNILKPFVADQQNKCSSNDITSTPRETAPSSTQPDLFSSSRKELIKLEQLEEIALQSNSISEKRCHKLMRFDIWHADGSGTNAIIGRQAHIAVLECDLFIEKFMVIAGFKYFA